MRRLKRTALFLAQSLLLGLASHGCLSPELAGAAIIYPRLVKPGVYQQIGSTARDPGRALTVNGYIDNSSDGFNINIGSHTGEYGKVDAITTAGFFTDVINASGFNDFTFTFSDSGTGRLKVSWVVLSPADTSVALDTLDIVLTSAINQIVRGTLNGSTSLAARATQLCIGKLWFRAVSGTSSIESLGPMVFTSEPPAPLGWDASKYRRVETDVYHALLEQKFNSGDPDVNPYTVAYTTDTLSVRNFANVPVKLTYVNSVSLTNPVALDWTYRKHDILTVTDGGDATEAINFLTVPGGGANQSAWLATSTHGDVQNDIVALLPPGSPTNSTTRSGYGRRAIAEALVNFGSDSTAFHSTPSQKTGIGIGYYTDATANYGWAPSGLRPLNLLYATFNDSTSIGGKWVLFTCPGGSKVGQAITLTGVPAPAPGSIAVFGGSTVRYNTYRLRLDYDGLNGRVYAYVNGILGAVQSNPAYLAHPNNAEEYGMCLFMQGGNNSTADFKAQFSHPIHTIFYPEK